jgi:hypothetical protein
MIHRQRYHFAFLKRKDSKIQIPNARLPSTHSKVNFQRRNHRLDQEKSLILQRI